MFAQPTFKNSKDLDCFKGIHNVKHLYDYLRMCHCHSSPLFSTGWFSQR